MDNRIELESLTEQDQDELYEYLKNWFSKQGREFDRSDMYDTVDCDCMLFECIEDLLAFEDEDDPELSLDEKDVSFVTTSGIVVVFG